MSVEEILIKLGLDGSTFNRGLKQAEGEVKQFGNRIKENIGDAFKTLAAPLAGVGLIAGLEKVFGKVEEIERASAAAGIGAEEFQRLAYAAKQVGIEGSQVEKSLEFLSKTIGEAHAGAKGATATFAKWGIAFNDTVGNARDGSSVFKEISDKMAGMSDDASKAAIATDFLSKSGAKFVAIMTDGSDALHKRGANAAIFTDGDIEQLKKAKEEIENVTNTFTVILGKAAAGGGLLWDKAVQWESLNGKLGMRDKRDNVQQAIDDANTLATTDRLKAMRAETAARIAEAAKVHVATQKELKAGKAEQHQIDRSNSNILHDFEKENLKAFNRLKKEAHEKEKAHEKEIADARRKHHQELVASQHIEQRRFKEEQKESALNKPFQSTIEELAGAAGWRPREINRMSTAAAQTARQYEIEKQNLQEDVANYQGGGDVTKNSEYIARRKHIESLRQSLEGTGIISPDDRLAKIEEGMTKLADQITADGLLVTGGS